MLPVFKNDLALQAATNKRTNFTVSFVNDEKLIFKFIKFKISYFILPPQNNLLAFDMENISTEIP